MITKNSDGTYGTTAWSMDNYWITPEGQKYLQEAYPVDKKWMTGEISLTEYKLFMGAIRNGKKIKCGYEHGCAKDAVAGKSYSHMFGTEYACEEHADENRGKQI